MKLASKIISVLLILALICFYAIPVLADTNTTTDQTVTNNKTTDTENIDQTTTVTDKDNQLAASISKEFNTTVTGQNIRDLRVSGMGYGSITIAYAIATASGNSISDITAMCQQGLGWGEIAHQLGVKFSDQVNKSSQALKTAKIDKDAKELKDQANQESQKDNKTNNNNKSSNNNSSNGSSNNNGKGNGKH
jgi:hypothetical protein